MRHAAMLAVLAVCVLAGSASAQFSISGTVTDQSLNPVVGVALALEDTSGTPIGLPPIVTDAAGFYTISPLPPGGYVVSFAPPVATRLVAQRVTTFIIGSSVTVSPTLDPGFLLSGVVTDTTGVGILNIDLKATDRDTRLVVYTPGDNTDSTGFYDVVLPAGRFDIKWRAVAVGALPWIDVEIRDVQLGPDTVIDITMVIGVFVSGTVRDPFNAPIANVNLDFTDNATGLKLVTPGDNTDLLGNYQVHVPTGSYTVNVKPLAATSYLGIEVTDVAVLGDMTMDYSLQSGVVLSGTVTDPLAAGVFNVDVDVKDPVTGSKIYTPFSTTDSLGAYAVVVPPGVYDLAYQPQPLTLLAPVEFPGVSVQTNTVHNVSLVAGLVLSGTVIDVFSVGVAGVDIDARDFATGVSVPLVGDATDALGAYSVVIAPGSYVLDAEPPKVLRLPAERISFVSLSQDTSISFFLVQGALIKGTVTDSVGSLIANVDVNAFVVPGGEKIFTPGDQSNASGFYEIVVPITQTYDFVFTPDLFSGITDTVRVENRFVNGDMLINAVFPIHIISGIPGQAPGHASELMQNFPNPFNPATTVPYVLRKAGSVRLSIYDVSGALVKVLLDGAHPAGEFSVRWDGHDARGRRVASGVYFYRLETPGVVKTRKMLLLK